MGSALPYLSYLAVGEDVSYFPSFVQMRFHSRLFAVRPGYVVLERPLPFNISMDWSPEVCAVHRVWYGMVYYIPMRVRMGIIEYLVMRYEPAPSGEPLPSISTTLLEVP